MRNYLIFTMFFAFILCNAMGQEGSYFSKKKIIGISNTYSFYTPNFENNELVIQKNHRGGTFFCNMDSMRVWTNNILKQVLTKEKINSLAYTSSVKNLLKASSMAVIYFDDSGKIQYITFGVNLQDSAIFTEDVLLKLYQTFKRTPMNMKNGKIDPLKTGLTTKDVYFTLTMPLYWWTKEERNVK